MRAVIKRLLLRYPPFSSPVFRHAIRYHLVARARRFLRWLKGDTPPPPPAGLRRFKVAQCETFFGYYDLSPLHADSARLLAAAVPGFMGHPNGQGAARVGYFDLERDNSFHDIGETETWCSQMGCRLRWFPNPEGTHVAYNVLVDGSHQTVIQDITQKADKSYLPMALYDISWDGTYGLSLNFARLGWLRSGYGYAVGGDPRKTEQCPDGDGIWHVDIATGQAKLIVSLDELATIEPSSNMSDAYHYINHIAINPSGTRFMFFHLWTCDPDDPREWSCRLFTANSDGSGLYLLEESGRPSHYAWRSDDTLAVFVVEHGGNGHYFQYTDREDRKETMGDHLPNFDGHLSFSPAGNWMLTDSYPDHYFEQSLLLFSDSGEVKQLGRYRPELRYFGDFRCDLHPRWDAYGRTVIFDSAHQGGRAMYQIVLRQ